MTIPLESITLLAQSLTFADVVVLQNEIDPKANDFMASMARTKGARIILNAAPSIPVTDVLRQLISILVVNEVEASAYAGMSVETGADAVKAMETLFHQWNVQAIVITLGSKGVVFSERNSAPIHLEALPVQSSDAHGAGDAFVGALAARIAIGDPLQAAVRYANAAAALTIALPFKERSRITPEKVFALIK